MICFYPMSKRRGGDDNWYALDFEERKALMAGHARVGRTYAGRVLQLITGSTGLDDWEWGVTLLADDPAALKEIVYEMRFDEVSARYAEFGPFFTGLVLGRVDGCVGSGSTRMPERTQDRTDEADDAVARCVAQQCRCSTARRRRGPARALPGRRAAVPRLDARADSTTPSGLRSTRPSRRLARPRRGRRRARRGWPLAADPTQQRATPLELVRGAVPADGGAPGRRRTTRRA